MPGGRWDTKRVCNSEIRDVVVPCMNVLIGGDGLIFVVDLDAVEGCFAMDWYGKGIGSLIETRLTDGNLSLDFCLIAYVPISELATPIFNGSNGPFRLCNLDESVSVLNLHNKPCS